MDGAHYTAYNSDGMQSKKRTRNAGLRLLAKNRIFTKNACPWHLAKLPVFANRPEADLRP
jgi:hypothetical protein